MKPQTKILLKKAMPIVPFGVALGIVAGLLFGFAIGCLACGLSTLIVCDYVLSNLLIDMEAKGINSYKDYT